MSVIPGSSGSHGYSPLLSLPGITSHLERDPRFRPARPGTVHLPCWLCSSLDRLPDYTCSGDLALFPGPRLSPHHLYLCSSTWSCLVPKVNLGASLIFFFFFLIEVKFTSCKSHHFQVSNSVVFSTSKILYNHYYLVPKYFHHSKRKLHIH